MKRLFHLSGLLLWLCSSPLMAQLSDTSVLFTVGDWPIATEEFRYVYHKNNVHDSDYNRRESILSYLELYKKFKLKVKAAMDAGYDTTKAFRREIRTYEELLLRPYFFDDSAMAQLMQQTYDNLQWELRASHILISVPPSASPKDTLAAYRKMLQIRKEVLAGVPFDSLAVKYSDDPSTPYNHGDLGWFTVFQMVYPFEAAAYRLKKGEVSMPVRTQFGYHLIKLTDRRPYRGDMEVSHILLRIRSNDDSATVARKRRQADSLYALAVKGKVPFEELARLHSEDPSSAPRGGRLPRFNSFSTFMPEAFRDAAFALKKDGDISPPVRTQYGFHIIKRIRHYPLPPYETVKPFLRRRIEQDPARRAIPEQVSLKKVKQTLGFREHPRAKRILAQGRFLDTTVLKTERSLPRPRHLNKRLFSLTRSGTTYRVRDFVKWLRAGSIRLQDDSLLAYQIRKQYKAFVRDVLRKEMKQYLIAHRPEHRYLLKEYREGMLLFNIMEDSVWQRALQDSAGLARFYERHKQRYRHQGKWKAIIYECHDLGVCDDVEEQLRNGHAVSQTEVIRYNSNGPKITYTKGAFDSAENEALARALAMMKPHTPLPYAARIDVNGIVYLVLVQERIPPGVEPFANVRGRVMADYQDELEKEWIARLRRRYPIHVNEKALDRLLP